MMVNVLCAPPSSVGERKIAGHLGTAKRRLRFLRGCRHLRGWLSVPRYPQSIR